MIGGLCDAGMCLGCMWDTGMYQRRQILHYSDTGLTTQLTPAHMLSLHLTPLIYRLGWIGKE